MHREYDIKEPEDAIKAISDVLRANGWDMILRNYTDQSSYQDEFITTGVNYFDGQLIVAKKDDVVLMFRSMGGLPVFDGQKKYMQKTSPNNLSPYFSGIVMTACNRYIHTEHKWDIPDGIHVSLIKRTDKWFNQPGVLRNVYGEAFGIGMPLPTGVGKRKKENGEEYIKEVDKIKLYINYCTEPTISCTISVRQGYSEKTVEGDYYDTELKSDVIDKYQYCHMSFCFVDKVGRWGSSYIIKLSGEEGAEIEQSCNGGIILSGSFNSNTMIEHSDIFEEVNDEDVINKTSGMKGILQNGKAFAHPGENAFFKYSKKLDSYANMLYSMSATPTTFCMIHVDNAMGRTKNSWASIGDSSNNFYTGKRLATSLSTQSYQSRIPKVPHYTYLLSKNSSDYGRNSNTLNGVTVNLPIALYVIRDPDELQNYSQIGYVSNIFEISLRNIQSGKLYEISYPGSGQFNQVFSHCIRKGKYGYDGFSITQEPDTDEAKLLMKSGYYAEQENDNEQEDNET